MFASNAGRSLKRKLLNQNTMFLKALKNVRNQVIAFLIFQLTAQETQFLLAITLLMEMLLYALQPTAFPIWRFCHFTVYVAN